MAHILPFFRFTLASLERFRYNYWEFMRLYDLVIVIKPSLSDAQKKKLLDSVKEFLKGVKVVTEEDWGQKPLAYKIKKELAAISGGVYLSIGAIILIALLLILLL